MSLSAHHGHHHHHWTAWSPIDTLHRFCSTAFHRNQC